ncbi:hypothetical protein [Methanobacterium sp. ACI-7]|uniref:hypothetical protein n=1 Tax=unclassified Methanobacterium TaxID=2627676 RepID=UPI0039C22ACF
MKLEFHGDLVSIYLPIDERDGAIAFLNKYKIKYEEVEITRIDKIYIQFSFYASETIRKLFNQFKETGN